jgi:uncharacterized protein (TIRG00374 family)
MSLRDAGGSVGRGIAVFALSLALGFGGLYLVAGDQLLKPGLYHPRDFSALVAAAAGLAFLSEWFLTPAVRIGLLCRGQGMGISYRSAALVHVVAMFGAAVTPGNAGVGPLTALALRRLGVPLGRGVGIALQVFVLDMIFFAWAVPLGLVYLLSSGAIGLPPGLRVAAMGVSAAALVGAVALGRFPRPVVRLLLALARWQPSERLTPKLRKIARDYYRGIRAFLNMSTASSLALHAITALNWLSGFMVLWLFLELYGVEIGLLQTFALLTSVTLVSHLVPTPGSSGFMEAAVGLGLGANPGEGGAAAVVLWRLTSYYVIFLMGPAAGWLLYAARKKNV